jgi:hypothetical protein
MVLFVASYKCVFLFLYTLCSFHHHFSCFGSILFYQQTGKKRCLFSSCDTNSYEKGERILILQADTDQSNTHNFFNGEENNSGWLEWNLRTRTN